MWLLFLIAVLSFGLAACGAQTPQRASAPAPGAAAGSPASAASPSRSLPKIVAFGDSLTAGYGLSPDESYPALLQQKLRADEYEYEVVNAGVSGDTTAGGLRRIDWALDGDVRIVILELGGNDFLRGQPVAEMKQNLAQIIERAKGKGAQVLLAGMEAPTTGGPEYRKEIHDLYPELAREHRVLLIPFFLAGVGGIESFNQADGIHPNREGTKIVVDNVYRVLQPQLKK